MDVIESNFIDCLRVEDNKRLMARYLMQCSAELKKIVPDYNPNGKTIREMLLLSIEYKIESCKFLVGMCYLYGLFSIEKSHGKAYKYLNDYMLSLKDGQDIDEVKMILAQMKYHGLGTQQSYSEAFQMLQTIKDRDNQKLNIMLAEMYFSGLGTERNYEKAYELIVQHASSSVKGSFYLQAIMLINGYGVDQDVRKGIQIIWSEGTKGCFMSQYFLGQMYEHGTFGLEKNILKAAGWYKKAAAQGLAVASISLSNLETKLKAEN